MRHAVAIVLVVFVTAIVAAQSPTDLFQQAMLDMFDGKWSRALEKLDEVQRSDAPDELKARSYFFAARALEKSGRPEKALQRYAQFLKAPSTDPSLRKEAGFAQVKIAAHLYMTGKKEYANQVVEALDSADSDLRFLAAVQLSYFTDKSVSRKAIPVLREKMSRDSDSEVQNQAALALLRIDPRLLEKKESDQTSARGGNLHLLLRNEDGEEIRLTLPVSLARLALNALPEAARKELKDEGINPDNILEMLSKAGEILEVKTNGSSVRLWID